MIDIRLLFCAATCVVVDYQMKLLLGPPFQRHKLSHSIVDCVISSGVLFLILLVCIELILYELSKHKQNE
ncbi:hypothetical protein VCRA2122O265_70139 [Vibrio crassostreae]|nr:hypothetical protein VCRA2118O239_70140 [Vibrio crassostreae]CAK2384245.1 hypothetical protein VCRA2113O217_70141 [Vibrio crassostreae]CAK3012983.1 hypothetical protein VCRA2117O235_70139 [Vibrio crassostreae]CAK3073498.1 hypothetical protein VCRA2118O238_60096 [Vibrio crassostreae]CAK3074528.1 hypothetical protein VCRA2120O252_60096 [Vibrio crassostreae]